MRIVFQLAIAILSLVAIISVMSKKKEHLLGPVGALFWIVFWIAIASVVSVPDVTQRIADLLGIGRGVDLVMYLSIAILLFLVFKLYIRVESMRRDMTEIARKKTLDSISERK